MFDKIAEKGYYSEKDGAEIIRSIVEAVRFCHLRGVVHRDLKVELNFYFVSFIATSPRTFSAGQNRLRV